jgi:hypothetical protein
MLALKCFRIVIDKIQKILPSARPRTTFRSQIVSRSYFHQGFTTPPIRIFPEGHSKLETISGHQGVQGRRPRTSPAYQAIDVFWPLEGYNCFGIDLAPLLAPTICSVSFFMVQRMGKLHALDLSGPWPVSIFKGFP